MSKSVFSHPQRALQTRDLNNLLTAHYLIKDGETYQKCY